MKMLDILLLLLFLCSCTLHPKYARPKVDTPQSWRISTEEIASYANICWWKQLQDPVLDELIDEALQNNQDLKVAIYRVDQFVAQLGIARSELYPQINANVGGERQRTSQTLPPVVPGITHVNNAYSLILNASYELDIWGKIRSTVEASLADLLAEIQARRTVVLTLIGSVASGYIQLRQFDQQLIIAKETLDSRNESLKLAVVRFDLGLTSLLQVQQAQSEVQSAEAEVDRLRISIGLQEDLISILIGKPPQEIKRGKILNEVCMPPCLPSCLPSELLNQRPDILQAEQNLIAANAKIGVAKALFFPDISLIGAYGAESGQVHQLLKHSSSVWQYGFSLLQEIFTGGRITNEVRRAEAEKMELLHQYQSTILSAFQDVNDALIAHNITLELVKVQKAQIETLKDYLRLSTLRYDNGQTDYLTVLDAERQLFTALLDYTQTQGESFTTLIDLYKALGGGWVTEADTYAEKNEKG